MKLLNSVVKQNPHARFIYYDCICCVIRVSLDSDCITGVYLSLLINRFYVARYKGFISRSAKRGLPVKTFEDCITNYQREIGYRLYQLFAAKISYFGILAPFL